MEGCVVLLSFSSGQKKAWKIESNTSNLRPQPRRLTSTSFETMFLAVQLGVIVSVGTADAVLVVLHKKQFG